MQLATPIVHLEKSGDGTHHIHVITWFDYTRFKANGNDTLSTLPSSGLFAVTLFVEEDSSVPDMQLLTPVVHTLTLTGIDLNGLDPFIEVEIYNLTEDASVSKRKVHRDSAGSAAMPDPGPGKP